MTTPCSVAESRVLAREREFEVVGEAADWPRRLGDGRRVSPSIVLMDLSLPAPGGARDDPAHPARFPRPRSSSWPRTRDEESLFASIKAGAAAFVIKDISPEDLIHVVRRVSMGDSDQRQGLLQARPSPRASSRSSRLASTARRPADLRAPVPREVEILDNIAQGMTNKRWPTPLSISEQTSRNHMIRSSGSSP